MLVARRVAGCAETAAGRTASATTSNESPLHLVVARSFQAAALAGLKARPTSLSSAPAAPGRRPAPGTAARPRSGRSCLRAGTAPGCRWTAVRAMWPVPTRTANRMPQSEPPAISPELNSVPALDVRLLRRAGLPLDARSARGRRRRSAPSSRSAGTTPTANDSEWMPHSSSVDRDEHADEHEAPRQVLAEQALDDRRHQRRLRRRQWPPSRCRTRWCR